MTGRALAICTLCALMPAACNAILGIDSPNHVVADGGDARGDTQGSTGGRPAASGGAGGTGGRSPVATGGMGGGFRGTDGVGGSFGTGGIGNTGGAATGGTGAATGGAGTGGSASGGSGGRGTTATGGGGPVATGGTVGTGGRATGGAIGSTGGSGTSTTGGASGSGGAAGTAGTQGATGGSVVTSTGGAPVPPPPLVITTTTLPDAQYNVAYDVQLAAVGGVGRKHWNLTSGSLPQGLDLTSTGNLRGIPIQDGGFTFTLGVSDESGSNQVTAPMVLKVLRKRWLVYRASASLDMPNNYGLYVIDVKSPVFKTPISTNIPPVTGSVADKFQFSPNGRYLAYLGSALLDYQLYVVDMSGDRPSEPRRVNDFGTARRFAWSPDSTSLAFAVETEQQTDIVVANVAHPEMPPQHLTGMLGDTNEMSFVSDDLVTVSLAEGQILYAQRAAGGGPFGQPQFLSLTAVMWDSWPTLATGAFSDYFDVCPRYAWNWHLIDFRTPRDTGPFNGFISVSPAADYLAHHSPNDLTYRVLRIGQTNPIATFSMPTRSCAPGSWSHDNRQFAAATDAGAMQVMRVNGSTVTTTTVPGSYGVLTTSRPPMFSPDDRWLGFPTLTGPYVVRNTQPPSTWPTPVGSGRAMTPGYGHMDVAFSPDSRYFASTEIEARGRSVYATVIDTAQTPPLVTERALTVDGGIYQMGWSNHSSEIALIARLRGGKNLYLFNQALMPLTTTDGNVTTLMCGSDVAGECPQVTAFQFQP